MHISLVAEKIFSLGSFSINNTLLTSWIVIISLALISYFGTKKIEMVPGKLQNILEIIIEGLFNFFNSVWENRKKTRKYFPLLATFFIFIIISNWFGLLPGIGSIGFTEIKDGHESFVPLFRSVNSDLNATLSWAIISIILVQVFGTTSLGIFSYFKKFFNFSNPINFFVGILEIVGEIAKIISFSFRLFGNVFAGEVLLVAMTFLVPYIAPLPFYGLELFVGFVQALVFTMLSLVFIKMATESHSQ
jgi:F-type H+-transporting ATPase subunit a